VHVARIGCKRHQSCKLGARIAATPVSGVAQKERQAHGDDDEESKSTGEDPV
jgi:hypothetical protein